MAVKIFCNACQNYIRDARKDEMHELKGTEICEECEGKIKNTWAEVDKMQKQIEQRMRVMISDARAKLDEAMRKVIREG